MGIDGTYLEHDQNGPGCGAAAPDDTITVTHQGNTLNYGRVTATGNADGSFSGHNSYMGDLHFVFATEGGRTVIHITAQNQWCTDYRLATKQ
jgi:hypothetical protein